MYQFRIVAFNAIYTSNLFLPDDYLHFSEPTSHIAALPPSQITVFSQSSVNYEKGKVKLQWTAPSMNGSPLMFYTIMKDVGSGVFYPLYQGIETSFTDVMLINGQAYNYKVYATNAAGDAPMSAPILTYAAELPSMLRQDQVSIGLQSLTALTINYEQPDSTGGLPILKYWVQIYNGVELDLLLATVDNSLALTYTETIT
jgi:hypothetical protein